MGKLEQWSAAIGKVVSGLVEYLSALAPGGAPRPPASGDEPLEVMTPRAFVIVYDPIMNRSTGERLTQRMGWDKVDQLVAGYIADVEECSGGLVKYRVVGRVDVDEFPVKTDGFSYTPETYMDVMEGRAQGHSPDFMDYRPLLDRQRLIERVTAGEFDEVWLFGFPWGGFYESRMVGKGAFWCNGPAMEGADNCTRRFVIMGFSYQTGVGEMLEDLGHRSETTLAHLFGSDDFWRWAYDRNRTPKTTNVGRLNLLERFLCFDQIAPGKSNVGTLHYAPNSPADYEWGVATPVPSCADDWYQFPNLPDPPNYRTMTTQDWGGGDIRAHHKWWFKHLPKAAGSMRGIRNNWWHYIIDVNDPYL